MKNKCLSSGRVPNGFLRNRLQSEKIAITVVFLMLLFGLKSAIAQSHPGDSTDTIPLLKQRIMVESSSAIFSSSVNAGLQSALLGLRTFPEDPLQDLENRDRHFLLTDLNFRISYFRDKASKDGFVGFNFAWRQNGFADLNDDFLRLLLAGNSEFAGDTAFIDQSGLLFQNYFSLGPIFSKQIVLDQENWTFSVQPQMLVGISDLHFSADNSWLYTAPYGESLDLMADYSYASNNGRPGGIGLGLNAEIQWMKWSKWIANFQIQDLGYLFWSKESEKIENNTHLQYDGIAIPSLSDLSGLKPDSVIADELIDPLYTDVIHNSAYSAGTMPSMNVSFSRLFKKSNLNISLKQYLHSGSANISTFSYNFPIAGKWYGSGRVGLISYGRPFAGFGLMYHMPGGTMFHLSVSDLTSVIKPEYSYIQSIYFSFNYSW